jgi:hypothetical protein
MKVNKKLLAGGAIVAFFLVVAWFCRPIRGVDKTYEIRSHVIPQYKTDAARAIDAYERLMDRHMDMTEKNLFRVGMDVQGIGKKLDKLDHKLGELSGRMARIEKALGIEQPKPPAVKKLQTKPIEQKPRVVPLPSPGG